MNSTQAVGDTFLTEVRFEELCLCGRSELEEIVRCSFCEGSSEPKNFLKVSKS